MEIDTATQILLNRTYRTYELLGRQLWPYVPEQFTLDDIAAMVIWPELRHGMFFIVPSDNLDDPGLDVRDIPISGVQQARIDEQPELEPVSEEIPSAKEA